MGLKPKKITFDPVRKEESFAKSHPKPAINFIPDWYKKIKPYTNDDTRLRFPMSFDNPNSTIKKCVPFLDALTIGYTAYLDEDLFVDLKENPNGNPHIRWRSFDQLLTHHNEIQFAGLPIPDEYHQLVYKWDNEWTIKLPSGYSAMFMHPVNRFDLPFLTLSGYVNCDVYKRPVQFPFFLKKDFQGIIPHGTPICQFFLVKHEPWESEVLEFDEKRTYLEYKDFFRTFVGSYKKRFWTRQSYK